MQRSARSPDSCIKGNPLRARKEGVKDGRERGVMIEGGDKENTTTGNSFRNRAVVIVVFSGVGIRIWYVSGQSGRRYSP